VASELREIVAAAGAALAGVGDVPWVLNAGPRRRVEVVAVPAELGVEGQPLADGTVAVLASVEGSAAGQLVSVVPDVGVVVGERVLENGLVRVVFDEDGLFSSVYDLVEDREVLAPGERGNLLRLHTDFPNQWDAWDIDKHYRHQFVDLTEVESIEVVERGPLVGAVRVSRRFGSSFVVQTVRLRAGSARIDVETEIDWHEREKILKAAFPLDVHADRSAAEIQFGHVFRPTHTNTSWEAARFEVFCHRWVHVGEPGYGVAVLNDSTYGHDVGREAREDGGTTTTLRLSLVRAPRCPDPEADQGLHRMTYSLLPGAAVADAVEGGYAVNLPLRVVAGGDGGGAGSRGALVEVEGRKVIVESVKLADDRSGDVVVRLYESLGGRASGTVLRTGFGIGRARVVDLLEREVGEELGVEADGCSVRVGLRPFQVLTVRLTPVG
jgi:alpha-mannosidase